jgi:hypothetical protein
LTSSSLPGGHAFAAGNVIVRTALVSVTANNPGSKDCIAYDVAFAKRSMTRLPRNDPSNITVPAPEKPGPLTLDPSVPFRRTVTPDATPTIAAVDVF